MVFKALAFVCVLAILAVAPARADDEEVIIGIDLGTTFSCVAVYRENGVEVISNDMGNRITPSIVGFKGDERMVGDAARNQQAANPQNTIYDVKRLIGRKFSDPAVKADAVRFPYKVVNDGGKPAVQVRYNDEDKTYTPEEISAMVLQRMKKIAETYIGHEVKKAVVTVPAYFNNDQRQATKNAGAIAGLTVERIIAEPTAASVAYGLDEKDESTVLVFDLGGGTFDVSLLSIAEGVFEVLATSGDTHLGGEDVNDLLQDYFVDIIKKKHGVDITKQKRTMQKLRNEVERAKRTLSTETTTQITLEAADFELNEKFTRAKYNDICNALFKRTLEPVKKVLADAGLKKKEVDEVVLVGGSTRIPRIQEMLSEFFGGKTLHNSINPDEAVCVGAAVQGRALSGGSIKQSDGTDNPIILIDVTPLTLGVGVNGGVMSPIIERNTHIPIKKGQEYTTVVDNQSAINIEVYQGEAKMVARNHRLGQFSLDNIAPAPAGIPQVIIQFKIDVNGILEVTATDKATKHEKKLTITGNEYRVDDEQVRKMMEDAKSWEEEDERAYQRVMSKNNLEGFAKQLRQTLKGEVKNALSSDEKAQLEEAISKAMDVALDQDMEKEDFDKAKEALEDVWSPIVTRVYGKQAQSDDDSGHQGHDDLEL